jgi:hypothetical protein
VSTWNALLEEFSAVTDPRLKIQWLNEQIQTKLAAVSRLRNNNNVLLYGSAFLQKPNAPAPNISITPEDIDGLMAVVHGMNWDQGLSLVLHTPGGVTNATETIVAYLRSKFPAIEAIVPTYAMSAGTMISLACERVVMSRQSQLGPIDPQMAFGGRNISARAIVEQFERARIEIVGDSTKGIQGDLSMAHVWAPVLATIGPALLQEAQNALDYSERMVARWLADYMFAGQPDREALGRTIAQHFNDASKHLSHGRRIDRVEARQLNVVVEDLEDSQQVQEEVLTLYHVMTIAFQNSTATKMIEGTSGGRWVKNWAPPNMTGTPGVLSSDQL